MLLSILMNSVTCSYLSVPEDDILEHTNAKCNLRTL